MFCTNCGNEINEGQRFCTSCGNSVKGAEKSFNSEIKQKTKKIKKPWTIGRVIKYVIVIIIVIGLLFIKLILGAIGLVDEAAVNSNDKGLSALDSGDYNSAIQHLEEASDSAVTSSAKMTTLTNLGYVYSSDGKYAEALQNFKEALNYATVNSFDYYLISGEIALLENKPQIALQHYKNAYNLKSDDFQINNALNLFYLDMNDEYPEYSDPQKALTHALKAHQASASETKGTATENLAIAYYLNGDFTKAITYFKQTKQDQPYIQLWLGMSYYSLGDYDVARPYLQRASNGGVTEADQFLATY
ncbi:MAG: tetratricopeptide repeat protein [Candidatus Paceibacterota bacterium]